MKRSPIEVFNEWATLDKDFGMEQNQRVLPGSGYWLQVKSIASPKQSSLGTHKNWRARIPVGRDQGN